MEVSYIAVNSMREKLCKNGVWKLNYIALKSVLMWIALILHKGVKFTSLVTRQSWGGDENFGSEMRDDGGVMFAAEQRQNL